MDKNNDLFVSFSHEHSHVQMHKFFEQTPMAIAILEGPEHLFTMANPQYKKLVGREVVGKKVLEAFTVEELGPYLKLVGEVFQTGNSWTGKDQAFHIPDADGFIQQHWLDIAYYPLRDNAGIITGVLAVINIVTEQYLARKILNENATGLPHMFWSARSDGFIDWYDDKFYSFTGMKRDSLWNEIGTPLHADDLEATTILWTESVTTGKTFEMNLRLKRKSDGCYHWFLSRAAPIFNEQGAISRWIGTLTDVHDDRVVLSQLQMERDMRERFVATLSHDLRSPIAAARMYAQLLIKNHGSPEVVEKYSLNIIKCIDRADQMIRDLLDANRITASEKLPINLEEADLRLIAFEVIEELRLTHGDRFKVNVPAKLQGLWSKSGLRRILENLINNAIKYGDDKKTVTVTLSLKDQMVVIEVHNWGTPILWADQTTLFEQYRRSASANAGSLIGWGLGLTLVKGIAEAHHGHISVSSSLESGTVFTVTLPVR